MEKRLKEFLKTLDEIDSKLLEAREDLENLAEEIEMEEDDDELSELRQLVSEMAERVEDARAVLYLDEKWGKRIGLLEGRWNASGSPAGETQSWSLGALSISTSSSKREYGLQS